MFNKREEKFVRISKKKKKLLARALCVQNSMENISICFFAYLIKFTRILSDVQRLTQLDISYRNEMIFETLRFSSFVKRNLQSKYESNCVTHFVKSDAIFEIK